MSAAASTVQEIQAGQAAAAPPAKKGKTLLIVIVLLLLGAAAGGGYWFYLHGQAAAAADHAAAAAAAPSKAPAIYLELTPAFVVNLEDTESMRYMQVDLQIMSRDPKAIEDAKAQMPRIRNSLLLLFGQQHAFDLATRQGKEALQAKALAEIQKVLKDETGRAGIEAVYFSSLVIQ